MNQSDRWPSRGVIDSVGFVAYVQREEPWRSSVLRSAQTLFLGWRDG